MIYIYIYIEQLLRKGKNEGVNGESAYFHSRRRNWIVGK